MHPGSSAHDLFSPLFGEEEKVNAMGKSRLKLNLNPKQNLNLKLNLNPKQNLNLKLNLNPKLRLKLILQNSDLSM